MPEDLLLKIWRSKPRRQVMDNVIEGEGNGYYLGKLGIQQEATSAFIS